MSTRFDTLIRSAVIIIVAVGPREAAVAITELSEKDLWFLHLFKKKSKFSRRIFKLRGIAEFFHAVKLKICLSFYSLHPVDT